MSSSDQDTSSIASEEELQSAKQRNGHGAAEASSLEDDDLLDESSSTDSMFAVNQSLNPDLLAEDEVDNELQAYAIKNNAILKHDENGQIKPVRRHPHGSYFKDNPSHALWRHRTIAERDLVASFDQSRSTDLSLHLYNSFKLKQRAKAQISDETGFVETKEPPKAWTAWPQTPDVVPRERQQRKWENEDWRMGPYVRKETRPGDELRELLMARVLKTAKERFEARGSEGSSGTAEEVGDQRPVVQADDEEAVKMLQPSVQHVLGRVDRLLMSLHRARSSYLCPKKSRGKGVALKSGVSTDEGTTKSSKRKLSLTDGERGLRESTNIEGEDSELKNSSLSKKQTGRPVTAQGTRQTSFSRRKARLGLRDWSDVLGLASLTGIDSTVVGRAASRCAGLLGEGMSFRTMYEGPGNDRETVYLPHGSTSNEPKALEEPEREDVVMHGGIHIDGFLQPIQGKKSWKYPGKPRKGPGVETVIDSDPGN